MAVQLYSSLWSKEHNFCQPCLLNLQSYINSSQKFTVGLDNYILYIIYFIHSQFFKLHNNVLYYANCNFYSYNS